MNYEDMSTLSTGQVETQRVRQYINAEHAARRYRDLFELITACPSIDLAAPIVQSSPNLEGSSRYVDEKKDLYSAFCAAGLHHRCTVDHCRLWYLIRIDGRSHRSIEGIDKRTVGRWVDIVDLAVDRELDARGLLVSSDALETARKEVR